MTVRGGHESPALHGTRPSSTGHASASSRTKGDGCWASNALWSSYRKWCSSCGLNKPKPLHQFIKDVIGFMSNKLLWKRPSGGLEGHMAIYGLSVKPIAEVQPEIPQSTLYGGVA